MLDHLTGGRLELGTSGGIPNEMALIGLGSDEARVRYDEAVEIIDKALACPVISHHGKCWNFDNLRLTLRTIQQPHPPKWVTVVSVSFARKAARRGAKISTGFQGSTGFRNQGIEVLSHGCFLTSIGFAPTSSARMFFSRRV